MVEIRHTWSIPNGIPFLFFPMRLKYPNSLLRTSHVTSLRNELRTSVNQGLSFFARDLVLSRARQGHVNLAHVRPWSCTLDVFEFSLVAIRVGELRQLLPLYFQIGNIGYIVWTDPFLAFGNYSAFAIGEGDYRGAEFNGFEGSILSDVTGAGNSNTFALEAFFATGGILDHVVDVLCHALAVAHFAEVGLVRRPDRIR